MAKGRAQGLVAAIVTGTFRPDRQGRLLLVEPLPVEPPADLDEAGLYQIGDGASSIDLSELPAAARVYDRGLELRVELSGDVWLSVIEAPPALDGPE